MSLYCEHSGLVSVTYHHQLLCVVGHMTLLLGVITRALYAVGHLWKMLSSCRHLGLVGYQMSLLGTVCCRPLSVSGSCCPVSTQGLDGVTYYHQMLYAVGCLWHLGVVGCHISSPGAVLLVIFGSCSPVCT